MICHFLYMKTADAAPLEGYFDLDEVGAKEVQATVFQHFDFLWEQTKTYTKTTIAAQPDGWPRLVITTNARLPEDVVLSDSPLKLLRRAN